MAAEKAEAAEAIADEKATAAENAEG